MRRKRVAKRRVIRTKPLPELLRQAEKVFNKWIRDRDKDEGCISCGAPGNQAGHYFPVKGYSSLRYHEHNVNLQCPGCNLFKHGNQAMYRIGLVKKIGEENVRALEEIAQHHSVKKWSREELEFIIAKYKINE